MASSVRSLSNHYETLKVDPTASTNQIVEAFSSQMRNARVRPDITIARLAQLSVAYETLRDPAKRRAYDASIGLKPAAPKPLTVNVTPFIGAPVMDRLSRLADPSPGPAQQPKQDPRQSVPPESRSGAFTPTSVREPAPREHSEPAAQARPQLPPAPIEEAAVYRAAPSIDEKVEIEDGRFAIGRTAATLGAGVIGVAVLAFAMALPGNNPDRLTDLPTRAHNGVTVALPPATGTDDAVGAPEAAAGAALPSPSIHHRSGALVRLVRSHPITSAAANLQKPGTAPADPLAPQAATVDSAPAQATVPAPDGNAADTPAEAPVATESAARLPLADATIARTIERIGYGCGRVVSTTAIDGGSGVYRITCSSGDSYRAAPVRGRYRFRRLGSR